MADYALTHYFPRLADTHRLAKRLAEGLEEAGCDIVAPVDTNMVFFDPSPTGLTVKQIYTALSELPDPIRLNANRCVIHHQTSPAAIEGFIAEVKRLAEGVPENLRPPPREKLGANGGDPKAVALGYGRR